MKTLSLAVVLALGCARAALAGSPAERTVRVEKRQPLTGPWEVHAVPDDPEQAKLEAIKTAKWHKLQAPFSLTSLPGLNRAAAEKVHFAWARHTFSAPAETKFRNAVLHLHGMCWGSKIWVNGKEVGEHLGAYGACEFDITGALKWGEANEILVRITGWPSIPRAEKMPPNHYRKAPLILHGPSLFGWASRQAHFRGEMWIDYFDYARLERVQILAEVGGAVRIRGLSRNYTRHYGERTVRARILRGGREVATASAVVPANRTGLSPRTPHAFEMKTEVKRPELWSPEAPKLYRAELEMVQDGMVLDRWAENFGFRKFEARGDGFYLNDRRIFMRGVCFWGEASWWGREKRSNPELIRRYLVDLPRAANVKAIRHHTIPLDGLWLEVADRHGMMLLQEFPMTINYIRPNFSKAELRAFRKNVMAEYRTMLPLYWNHPSIVMWVSTNESPRENAEWENGPLQRLFKDVDPARPVMRSGVESDDIYDTHNYGGFWSGSEGQFAIYAAAAARRGRTAGKPIGNTEYVENFGGGRVTKWMGPKPEKTPKEDWDVRRRDVNAQFILEQSEVLRRLGYDVTMPYAWGSGYLRRVAPEKGYWEPLPNFYALRSAMSPVLASFDLADRHFVAGSELKTSLLLCDDTGRAGRAKARIAVVSGNPGFTWPSRRQGVVTLSEQEEVLRSAGKRDFRPRRKAVRIKLPTDPGRYYLLAVTKSAGRPAAVSRRILHLVAPAPVGKLAGRRISLIAADRKLAADLSALAPGVKFVDKVAGADVLVIGPFIHRRLELVTGAAAAIRAFAKAGGRVVVLEQDRPIPALNLEMPRSGSSGGSSTAFRTSSRDFYAWRGLGQDDRVLRRFNGRSGAVVRRPLKPGEKDEVLLKAAQGSRELNWPVVARRKVGKGEVVFCQMPLHRHLGGADADPVARTIMTNLLVR